MYNSLVPRTYTAWPFRYFLVRSFVGMRDFFSAVKTVFLQLKCVFFGTLRKTKQWEWRSLVNLAEKKQARRIKIKDTFSIESEFYFTVQYRKLHACFARTWCPTVLFLNKENPRLHNSVFASSLLNRVASWQRTSRDKTHEAFSSQDDKSVMFIVVRFS